jgi:hypothetical protein
MWTRIFDFLAGSSGTASLFFPYFLDGLKDKKMTSKELHCIFFLILLKLVEQFDIPFMLLCP